MLFRYQPDDGISNFLTGTTAGNPQIGRLDFKGSTTAMLEVPIYDDNITEDNGKVSVELLVKAMVSSIILSHLHLQTKLK